MSEIEVEVHTLPADDFSTQADEPDDTACDRSARRRSAHVRGTYIGVRGWDDGALDSLVEADPRYCQWLRLVMLRTAIIRHTACLGGSDDPTDGLAHVIGLEGTTSFAVRSGHAAFVEALRSIERIWAADLGALPAFPGRLARNLSHLQSVIALSDVEASLLGLGVLIHAEPILESTLDSLGKVKGVRIPRILAALLNLPVDDVERALSAQGALAHSGLLTIDGVRAGEVITRIDLIGMAFANRMVTHHDSLFHLMQGFAAQAPAPSLAWNDYAHMHERLQGVEHHLQHALSTRRRGVNVLLYGEPGAGKTQLARLLAARLQKDLISVGGSDSRGDPIDPMDRTKYYRLAQCVFGTADAIVLLDECEDMLRPRMSFGGDLCEPGTASKAWINDALEGNPTPTIWICNSVAGIDPAYIRRFDFCVKFEPLTYQRRRGLLQQRCGAFLDASVLDQVARNEGATPALIAKAAEIVDVANAYQDPGQHGPFALQWMNQKLTASGFTEVKAPPTHGLRFTPRHITTSMDVAELADGLRQSRQGRLCIYGPPGTGKTAYGQWLADQVGAPHLVRKASDLLRPHVGESEMAIARAFEQATRDGAVLQFDEVDTFLSGRTSRQRTWEVSLVNEMLVQLESFQGIFIASTNLYEGIDEAALRRFDLSLKFDFLRPESAAELFEETCAQLGLGAPEPSDLREIRAHLHLTPGDFQQALRQSRFAKPATRRDLLDRLQAAVSAKPHGRAVAMGFLAAVR